MTFFRHTVLFLVAAWLVVLAPVCSFSGEAGPRSVLILNSYHEDFKWTASQVSAAKSVLKDAFEDVEIFVEYMDTKRVYDDGYLDSLFQIYQRKYSRIGLDAVITTDDNALWFVLAHRTDLFRDIPVSFCGINDYDHRLLAGHSRITGVVEVLDIGPTIDLALTLHPGTRRIAVVVDSTPTGIGQLKDVQAAARYFPDIEFIYLEGKDLSHEDLFKALETLSPDTVVLLTVWLRDRHDTYLSPEQGGPLISGHSAVPVYGIIDMYFSTGIVGGKLLNSATHGRAAAEKAVTWVTQDVPKNLPVVKTSINPYMFDYSQLKRWHVPLDRLPEESVIINRPVSLYDRYKPLIYSVLGVFVLLVVLIGYLAVNIAHRKKAEQLLAASERKWRDVLVNTPQIGVGLDRNGAIVFANPSLLALTGWAEAEVIGQNWFDLFIPEPVREEIRRVFDTVMRQKDTAALSSYENEIITRNGEIRYIAWSNVVTLDTRGEVVDVTCLGIDLTERRTWEKALQESEAVHRTILAAMDDPIYITSPDFCIEYMNPAMIEKIGRDATGETCFQAIHGRNSRCGWCRYDEVLAGQVVKAEFDRLEDGRTYYISYAPVSKADGTVCKLSVYRDITEMKQLEIRMQQAQKMESIGSLAGGIAHDFNNLLFPIIGLSEMMLLDMAPGTPEYENLQEILRAGRRGKELVRQILAFSRRNESRRMPVRFEVILKEVIKLCRATIPSDIAITRDIQPNCGMVLADPTQLHQVAMNLITNAYHAVTTPGGKIHVKLEQVDAIPLDIEPLTSSVEAEPDPGPYILFSVSDNGCGMEPGIIKKIFDPYFTTKEPGRGTGLGLSVVLGIVRQCRGEVTVHTELGQGSTFQVYLPVMKEDAREEASEKQAALPNGNEHVLLVDDEPVIVEMLQHALERLGYRVTGFTASMDALTAFRKNPQQFDLVLADMSMPRMNGEHLVREMTAVRQDIPVIICTGFSERLNRDTAASLGIKGLLLKPVILSDLARVVRRVLDGPGDLVETA
jgi:PAS domain S-box-containing protein